MTFMCDRGASYSKQSINNKTLFLLYQTVDGKGYAAMRATQIMQLTRVRQLEKPKYLSPFYSDTARLLQKERLLT